MSESSEIEPWNNPDVYQKHALGTLKKYGVVTKEWVTSFSRLKSDFVKPEENLDLAKFSTPNLLHLFDCISVAVDVIKDINTSSAISHIQNRVKNLLQDGKVPIYKLDIEPPNMRSKRLTFISDEWYDSRKRASLAKELGVDGDYELYESGRKDQCYEALIKSFQDTHETTSSNPIQISGGKESQIDAKKYILPDEVYKLYLDGRYDGYTNIQEFDLTINYLLQNGLIEVDRGYTFGFSEKFSQPDLLRKAMDIVSGWNDTPNSKKNENPVDRVNKEILSAFERIGLFYSNKTTKELLDLELFDLYDNNPGYILGLPPIYTEAQREKIVSKGNLRDAYRKTMMEYHPDITNNDSNFVRSCNLANEVLNNSEKFTRFLNGYSIFNA